MQFDSIANNPSSDSPPEHEKKSCDNNAQESAKTASRLIDIPEHLTHLQITTDWRSYVAKVKAASNTVPIVKIDKIVIKFLESLPRGASSQELFSDITRHIKDYLACIKNQHGGDSYYFAWNALCGYFLPFTKQHNYITSDTLQIQREIKPCPPFCEIYEKWCDNLREQVLAKQNGSRSLNFTGATNRLVWTIQFIDFVAKTNQSQGSTLEACLTPSNRTPYQLLSEFIRPFGTAHTAKSMREILGLGFLGLAYRDGLISSSPFGEIFEEIADLNPKSSLLSEYCKYIGEKYSAGEAAWPIERCYLNLRTAVNLIKLARSCATEANPASTDVSDSSDKFLTTNFETLSQRYLDPSKGREIKRGDSQAVYRDFGGWLSRNNKISNFDSSKADFYYDNSLPVGNWCQEYHEYLLSEVQIREQLPVNQRDAPGLERQHAMRCARAVRQLIDTAVKLASESKIEPKPTPEELLFTKRQLVMETFVANVRATLGEEPAYNNWRYLITVFYPWALSKSLTTERAYHSRFCYPPKTGPTPLYLEYMQFIGGPSNQHHGDERVLSRESNLVRSLYEHTVTTSPELRVAAPQQIDLVLVNKFKQYVESFISTTNDEKNRAELSNILYDGIYKFLVAKKLVVQQSETDVLHDKFHQYFKIPYFKTYYEQELALFTSKQSSFETVSARLNTVSSLAEYLMDIDPEVNAKELNRRLVLLPNDTLTNFLKHTEEQRGSHIAKQARATLLFNFLPAISRSDPHASIYNWPFDRIYSPCDAAAGEYHTNYAKHLAKRVLISLSDKSGSFHQFSITTAVRQFNLLNQYLEFLAQKVSLAAGASDKEEQFRALLFKGNIRSQIAEFCKITSLGANEVNSALSSGFYAWAFTENLTDFDPSEISIEFNCSAPKTSLVDDYLKHLKERAAQAPDDIATRELSRVQKCASQVAIYIDWLWSNRDPVNPRDNREAHLIRLITEEAEQKVNSYIASTSQSNTTTHRRARKALTKSFYEYLYVNKLCNWSPKRSAFIRQHKSREPNVLSERVCGLVFDLLENRTINQRRASLILSSVHSYFKYYHNHPKVQETIRIPESKPGNRSLAVASTMFQVLRDNPQQRLEEYMLARRRANGKLPVFIARIIAEELYGKILTPGSTPTFNTFTLVFSRKPQCPVPSYFEDWRLYLIEQVEQSERNLGGIPKVTAQRIFNTTINYLEHTWKARKITHSQSTFSDPGKLDTFFISEPISKLNSFLKELREGGDQDKYRETWIDILEHFYGWAFVNDHSSWNPKKDMLLIPGRAPHSKFQKICAEALYEKYDRDRQKFELFESTTSTYHAVILHRYVEHIWETIAARRFATLDQKKDGSITQAKFLDEILTSEHAQCIDAFIGFYAGPSAYRQQTINGSIKGEFYTAAHAAGMCKYNPTKETYISRFDCPELIVFEQFVDSMYSRANPSNPRHLDLGEITRRLNITAEFITFARKHILNSSSTANTQTNLNSVSEDQLHRFICAKPRDLMSAYINSFSDISDERRGTILNTLRHDFYYFLSTESFAHFDPDFEEFIPQLKCPLPDIALEYFEYIYFLSKPGSASKNCSYLSTTTAGAITSGLAEYLEFLWQNYAQPSSTTTATTNKDSLDVARSKIQSLLTNEPAKYISPYLQSKHGTDFNNSYYATRNALCWKFYPWLKATHPRLCKWDSRAFAFRLPTKCPDTEILRNIWSELYNMAFNSNSKHPVSYKTALAYGRAINSYFEYIYETKLRTIKSSSKEHARILSGIIDREILTNANKSIEAFLKSAKRRQLDVIQIHTALFGVLYPYLSRTQRKALKCAWANFRERDVTQLAPRELSDTTRRTPQLVIIERKSSKVTELKPPPTRKCTAKRSLEVTQTTPKTSKPLSLPTEIQQICTVRDNLIKVLCNNVKLTPQQIAGLARSDIQAKNEPHGIWIPAEPSKRLIKISNSLAESLREYRKLIKRYEATNAYWEDSGKQAHFFFTFEVVNAIIKIRQMRTTEIPGTLS